MQRLLRTAVWDADAVRDDLRGFVAVRLGDPAEVLIPDETGFMKRGMCSVGVHSQSSGTAGRIENSQVGVPQLRLSTQAGADRPVVYLPRSSVGDPQRCTAAGIPASAQFMTRPDLTLGTTTGAVAAGVPAEWAASAVTTYVHRVG